MKNLRTAIVLSLCIVVGAALAPVTASAAVGIDITVAPPAPQVEVVPAPRPGYIGPPAIGHGAAMRMCGFPDAG